MELLKHKALVPRKQNKRNKRVYLGPPRPLDLASPELGASDPCAQPLLVTEQPQAANSHSHQGSGRVGQHLYPGGNRESMLLHTCQCRGAGHRGCYCHPPAGHEALEGAAGAGRKDRATSTLGDKFRLMAGLVWEGFRPHTQVTWSPGPVQAGAKPSWVWQVGQRAFVQGLLVASHKQAGLSRVKRLRRVSGCQGIAFLLG